MESAIVAFGIEKDILDEFDQIGRKRGIYERSEGLRKLVISAVERGKVGNAC